MRKILFAAFTGMFLVTFTSVSASDDDQPLNTPEKYWEIGLTGGTTVTQTYAQEYSFVRAVGASYYDNSPQLDAQSHEVHGGIYLERCIPNSKIAFATGIQYKQRTSRVGRTLYEDGFTDQYFHVLYQSQGTQTDLARVNYVKEELSYINVPIEGRIYPFEPCLFNLFFGLGAEYGHLLYAETTVDFHADHMDHLNDDIAALYNKPSDYYLSGYGTIGFVLRYDNIHCRLQAFIPALYFNEDISGLVMLNEMRGGVQATVALPL
jgi:hypothetical protein